MGMNSLPKTVTRQRRDCDLNSGPSAPVSSTLTTRLPSHPMNYRKQKNKWKLCQKVVIRSIHFDRTPTCDRQTQTHRHTLTQYWPRFIPKTFRTTDQRVTCISWTKRLDPVWQMFVVGLFEKIRNSAMRYVSRYLVNYSNYSYMTNPQQIECS